MAWLAKTLDELARQPVCGYHAAGPAATEPTALAALALIAHRHETAARPALAWLVRGQQAEGSLGVTDSLTRPRWPTSLAVLAWQAADRASERPQYAARIQRAVDWILATKGTTPPRQPHVGHDTTLLAWPWVDGTHSWLEPTALHTLALSSAGYHTHPRTREAVQVLIDRQLPTGGCNYGNTRVLNQATLPHIQPTGLAMLALAPHRDTLSPAAQDRVDRSLEYLAENIGPQTTSASLAWAVLGLRGHGRELPDTALLAGAAHRTHRRGAAPHRLALLALAANRNACPLLPEVESAAGS